MASARASLLSKLPQVEGERLSQDQILDRFVTWAEETGLTLYPAQEEAILELLEGKHLVLNTPTGSGKSLVAQALHFKAMAEGKVSFYTSPIKALVNEKFFALCEAFDPDNVGMMTGDASINRNAPIICCTAEILANIALRDPNPRVDYAVLDEFHYYGDRDRGVAWQLPLLALPRTTFLMMSATLGDTSTIEERLAEDTGRKVAAVRSAQRPVPLDFEYRETPLHETIEELIGRRKAPIYLVNFTQRAAAEQAQNLMSANFSSKEEKEQIRQALGDTRFDTPYGKEVQKFLKHGVGLHHAGLLPKYRLLVEKLSQSGLLKVISGTDTLGVGVNIPIRTVLFSQLFKFNGEKLAILSNRDFHQIAGRAGRKGFDEQGSVVAQAPEHVVENVKLEARAQAGKKVVKKQPPQKGFVHWDRATFERLQSGVPEPLESRFQVSHGMLLAVLQADRPERGGGYGFLVQLIRRSHGRDYDHRQQLKLSRRMFRTLLEAGIIRAHRAPGGGRVDVSPGLQKDFSLHQTLSLYLVEALERLDPATEGYPLDLLTLVEAILENPEVVLYAQLNKLKGEEVARMKSEGIEYDERMAKLDQLEWPKPNRDFIYGTFNLFAQHHPWVGEENIRPKSIAREMAERFIGFNDYVREYGIQRSEGVLLRYLADVYKTLVQSVPEGFRDERVEELIELFRTMLRQTDSSLLEEWEGLKAPAGARLPEEKLQEKKPEDLAANLKRLNARIRTELHLLTRALARKDYEEAQALLRDPDWTEERLAAEWEKLELGGEVDVTPRSRRPEYTLVKPTGTRRWDVAQTLLGPGGPTELALHGEVDLGASRPPDAPLVRLVRLGA